MKVGHVLPAELASLWAPTTLEEVQGHSDPLSLPSQPLLPDLILNDSGAPQTEGAAD